MNPPDNQPASGEGGGDYVSTTTYKAEQFMGPSEAYPDAAGSIMDDGTWLTHIAGTIEYIKPGSWILTPSDRPNARIICTEKHFREHYCQSLKHQLEAAVQLAEAIYKVFHIAQCDPVKASSKELFHQQGTGFLLEKDIPERIKKNVDELREKLAECERERDELKRGIANQERVLEVCNQEFRDASKAVQHLWEEIERPAGIQMICMKLKEIAEERDRLRAENAGLREALGPFAAVVAYYEGYHQNVPDDMALMHVQGWNGSRKCYEYKLTVGHLRAAQRALQGGGGVG